jgi:hypothetical protein
LRCYVEYALVTVAVLALEAILCQDTNHEFLPSFVHGLLSVFMLLLHGMALYLGMGFSQYLDVVIVDNNAPYCWCPITPMSLKAKKARRVWAEQGKSH